MSAPDPTPIVRFIHVDTLSTYLRCGIMHAPNHCLSDGLTYIPIHDQEVQNSRRMIRIPCSPGGTLHDYVPFYFGYLSPMILKLKTGQVPGYTGGQKPLIYLETTAQVVRDSGAQFVFSDGHGLAAYTDWFGDLEQLDKVDWQMVYQRYWSDKGNDLDRQRRKQAEFLIHRYCS